MAACPAFLTDDGVSSQINVLNERASAWSDEASGSISALTSALSFSYSRPSEWGGLNPIGDETFGQFTMPADPDVPDLSYATPAVATIRTVSTITPPVSYVMPTYDVVRPTLDLSGTPGPAPEITLSAVPTVVAPTLGAAPVIVAPAAPMAVSVDSISALPTRTAPAWSGVRPDLDTSGVPGAAPDLDVGAVPDVTRPVLGSAPVPIEPSAPLAVTLPALDTLPTRTVPTWGVTRPELDLSGAPGSAPVLDITDPPTVLAPVVPTAPTVTAPALPRVIPTASVPDIPARAAPTWTVERPTLDTSGQPGPAPASELPGLPTFPAPSVPNLAALTVPAAPLAVAVTSVDEMPLRTAPVWDVARPLLDMTGAPGGAPVIDIGAPPEVVEPDMPVAPSAAGPTLPTLVGVTLPVLADLTLPDVRVSVPLRAFMDLENGFAFSAERYTSAQMDLIQSHVARVLNAGLGIPESVWEAIWSRAAGQLARQFITRERQGRRAHAAKGWTMPGNSQLAAQELAAQEINEQISAKATEQAAQRAIQEREDFWKAMQEGVALESLLVQAQNQFLELELRGAVAQQEAEVAVFNAQLAGYTQDLAAVSVTLDERKTQLQAALSRLEMDRLRLEGAKLLGDIDRNAIALYTAQWEGVRSAVEVYKGQLQGVEAQLSVQRLEMDAHRLKLEDKNAELDAWAKEWQGFATKVQSQQAIAGVYSTDAQVFGERVQAYQALIQSDTARSSAQVAVGNLRLEASRTDISRYSAEWERARAESQSYRDAVAGATLTIEGQKLELERYGQALREREVAVAAWAKEWDGFNTKIQAQQAIAGMYQIDADVFGKLTSAYQVLTQVDIARADNQVKVAQLGIEASRADIERYTAQWEQARAQSQGYRDAIAGAGLAIDGQKLLLEGHAAEIQTQDLALRAWTQEWDGYAKKVAAQQALAGIYKIDAEVFGQLVNAYQTAVQADVARSDVQIRGSQLTLEQAKTDISRYTAEWERARAESQAYQDAIRAAELDIAAQKLVLDGHGMKLKDKELAVQVWAQEWAGFETKIKAQQAIAGLYEIDANVFGKLVAAYQTAVQADATRSDAEVKAATLRIEAARADIARYSAQWEQARAEAQSYQNAIAGAQLSIESQKLMLTGHEMALKDKEIEVDTWAKQWQGYGEKVKGQTAVAGMYEAEVRAFGERVKGVSTQVEAEKVRVDAEASIVKAQVDTNIAEITRYKAEWEAISSKLNALATIYSAETGLFSSKVQGEGIKVNADVQVANLDMEKYRIDQTTMLEDARLASQQLIQTKEIQVTALTAISQIYGQLVSAAYAAGHISMTNSFGVNQSRTCAETA